MTSQDREDLAEQRTDWAEDRTLLSNERTYAGWTRTGFASVGVGLAIQAIFNRVEPTWMAKLAATAFFVVAILIFWVSYRKAIAVVARLDGHSAEPVKRTGMVLTCGVVTGATGLLTFLLWGF